MTTVAQRPTDEPGPNREVPLKGRPKPSQTALDDQRRAALKMANATRTLHRQLKEELAGLPMMESRNLAGHVILCDRERFASIQIGSLLKAIRGWGPEKTRRLCQLVNVSERTRLRAISCAHAQKIAALLGDQRLKGLGDE